MKAIPLLVLAALFAAAPVHGATVIGFGLFENRSDDRDLDFLSGILINSFAVSVETDFDITAKKPAELEQYLEETGMELKGSYRDKELYDLASALPVNYFVYGSFRPVPENRIEMTVNIYNKDTGELFSFVNTGKMETEIFNLVDRLTGIFEGCFKEDFRFKSDDIPAKTKIAFITNLDARELNEFYMEFMKQGYRICPVQGNDLASPVSAADFDRLRHVALKEKSFQRITNTPPLVFSLSQWEGKKEITAQRELRDIITRYVYRYPAEQEKVIKELSSQYRFNIDYLCIVGFDESRERAWIRGFDLTHFDSSLIWIESGIKPMPSASGPSGIAASIIHLSGKQGQK